MDGQLSSFAVETPFRRCCHDSRRHDIVSNHWLNAPAAAAAAAGFVCTFAQICVVHASCSARKKEAC